MSFRSLAIASSTPSAVSTQTGYRRHPAAAPLPHPRSDEFPTCRTRNRAYRDPMSATPLPPTGEPPVTGPKTCDASGMLDIHRMLLRSFTEATALVDGVAEGDTRHAGDVATQLHLISTALRVRSPTRGRLVRQTRPGRNPQGPGVEHAGRDPRRTARRGQDLAQGARRHPPAWCGDGSAHPGTRASARRSRGGAERAPQFEAAEPTLLFVRGCTNDCTNDRVVRLSHSPQGMCAFRGGHSLVWIYTRESSRGSFVLCPDAITRASSAHLMVNGAHLGCEHAGSVRTR